MVRKRKMLKDERGQMSIDFLAGLSLFMLTLLFLVHFIPGMFVPFQTETIDLSSVAYRTSVILVEDPGWWDDGTDKGEDWENQNVENVSRVGLAIDKEHPNVLNISKIDVFDNDTQITDANLTRTLGLYRKIGGNEIDYGYNITIEDSEKNILAARGDPIPEYGDVSSMKRLMKAQTGTVILLKGDELKGEHPLPNDFALFNITEPEEDITIIIENILIQAANPKLLYVAWDDDTDGIINPVTKLDMGTDAEPYDYRIWLDKGTGNFVQQVGAGAGPPWGNPNIDLPPVPYNTTSRLKITISKGALNTNPGVTNQIMVKFNQVYIIKYGAIDLNEAEKSPIYESAMLIVKIWT